MLDPVSLAVPMHHGESVQIAKDLLRLAESTDKAKLLLSAKKMTANRSPMPPSSPGCLALMRGGDIPLQRRGSLRSRKRPLNSTGRSSPARTPRPGLPTIG